MSRIHRPLRPASVLSMMIVDDVIISNYLRFCVNCWHLAKTCFSKFLHLMSDGAKQNIDCRRSYMAFYILSDNRGINAIGLTFVVQMLTC